MNKLLSDLNYYSAIGVINQLRKYNRDSQRQHERVASLLNHSLRECIEKCVRLEQGDNDLELTADLEDLEENLRFELGVMDRQTNAIGNFADIVADFLVTQEDMAKELSDENST